ncbi:HAMP domain-containing histidine kinase [Acetatifactor muris]|uniref:histidine kinase n=1 Tax=Acetatifactor muris TaxID=879566 RepID=A0A2K4ZFV0_9FIRM|nr:HAMP domain-containing sensor histidine kinase [Acetatifactor muris]MCR2047641.1 HAMP domain-containing histidine kinase [Acetatifactor muris]SOY29353.1 Signal-transduction histidine kinase senX3 [Acetatifactor muris]
MKLGRKNLLYSMALAGMMLLLLVGYFIYMLPSLYVDYVMEQNLKSVREQHIAYRDKGSYDGVKVRNSTACFSVEIPLEGNRILVTGKSFSAELIIRDLRLSGILDRCREKLTEKPNPEEDADYELRTDLDELGEILQETVGENPGFPVEIHLLYKRDMGKEFRNESIKVHSYSDHLLIIESSVEDSANRYANYIVMEQTDSRLILSVLPVVAPEAAEIRPVVLQSLPMLGAVILLLVLLSSQMYSRGIVGPIAALAEHAGQMKAGEAVPVRRFSGRRTEKRDEVQALADTLDDFYFQIRESYLALEEKNGELEEENKRQEVFLRASSHQLKTPIAAALLLVDGMTNKVGKYRDVGTYLPKVKEQLLSMRKMVEEILYLNRCAEHMRLQETDAGQVLTECLQSCQVALTDRCIAVEFQEKERLCIDTDEVMAAQIFDNLLSNAVKYTPCGGRITISVGEEAQGGSVRIENFGVTIPEALLPRIFEPFVSGDHGRSQGTGSHGLGLYIASYYAKKLNINLSIYNGENSVVAEVTFDRTGVCGQMEKSSMSSSSEIHTAMIE